jgi:glycosyltransferase involved in cell wall biosynthesis
MEDKKPLLSICIPTYNRAQKLYSCLQAVSDAINEEIRDKIEVIISDNASTDNTKEIVEKFTKRNNNYTYNKNDYNLGYTRNVMLLLNYYSQAKYIWIIGDDDFIDRKSVHCIVNLLESDKKPDLITLKHRVFINNNEYAVFHNSTLNKGDVSLLNFQIKPLGQALDEICDYGNILGSFMSSMIYNKEKIDRVFLSKISMEPDYWSDKVQDQFPNAYLVLSSYIGTQKCYCSTEPLLSTINAQKEWNDKLSFLYFKVLPNLYFYLIDIGLDKYYLKKTRKYLFLANLILIRDKSVKKSIILKNMIIFFSWVGVFEFLNRIFRKYLKNYRTIIYLS